MEHLITNELLELERGWSKKQVFNGINLHYKQ